MGGRRSDYILKNEYGNIILILQVWRDLKFKVKKKMATNKAERMATGGGSFKQFILSPLEEAVANLLDFQKQLNPEGQFQGVPSASEDNEVQRPAMEADISNIDEWWTDDSIPNIQLSQSAPGESVQQTSSRGQQDMPAPTKQKRKSNAVKDLDLLQKHSEEQAKHLTDISNTLTSIKQSVRDGIRYQKKLLELEERKIKILEEKNKREKEVHESEMRIKRLKIAIKEKELKLFQEREN